MFHSFLSSLTWSKYCLAFCFLWCSLGGSMKRQNSRDGKFSFFLLIYTEVWFWWPVWISKSQRILFVSFSRIDPGLCIYHLVIWSNFNFLHNFESITFSTQSCLDLYTYSFCASSLHLLILWLTVSLLFNFYLYFSFLIILHKVFTQDIRPGKIIIICILCICFLMPLLGVILQSHWSYSHKRMKSFARSNFWYFI